MIKEENSEDERGRMMFYFITSSEDVLTSAIELAQAKRLKIFEYLNKPARIVTLKYNHSHHEAEKKLGTGGRVINLYQYFQHLEYQPDSDDRALVSRILNRPGLKVNGLTAYRDDKKRINVVLDNKRIYYVDYLDRFGFTDRRDFYDNGCRSYTEYFEDRARVVMRQYYDNNGAPVLTFHYRGGEKNVPVLTLIQLRTSHGERQFDSEDQLRAYFLDRLIDSDPQAVLVSDRSDYALKPFQLLKHQVPRYQVFHSCFTQDGQPDGDLFTVYEPLKGMLEKGQLTGLISATKREAQDAGRRFDTRASYGIPVTYLPDEVLDKQVPFRKRIPGQLIAVARLTNVKRLDQIIDTVIRLHRNYPQVDLKIYGYDDSWNNYATSHSLKTQVQEQQAGEYIHFCGYRHDLTSVYEQAQVEVLTSSYEGFAMALLEAQGHGCPVVSYDINYGPAEIVDDQVSGRLLPAGDMQQLYTVLADLLANPRKLADYAAHAQHAAARYSLDRVAKDWTRFLDREKLN